MLCAVLRARAARQSPAQQFMTHMGKDGTVTSIHPDSLILTTTYYRGWMTPKEMAAFDAKDYAKFNELSAVYNEKNGYPRKRKRDSRPLRSDEYIQYA